VTAKLYAFYVPPLELQQILQQYKTDKNIAMFIDKRKY
jgi:hypothetical protein